jgi:hypothetical protein
MLDAKSTLYLASSNLSASLEMAARSREDGEKLCRDTLPALI